ncbi:NitT/TauT family transport system substrate-binding protein [Mariniphaga anaerophila]|uniref:NitT/TauT family transport system substrate-binding protein n=1 Tax=Mariniphaga anaerophila TaxID=1484053 RepID=A0A1M5FD73_9BACT|nr:ABC transporter substrate-binding protein [Mariniphaga anaerophila]SHF89520.1 NitT/TauT family transport system substrate-binding protein [Mariniphaga anaerophila]
MRIRFFIIIFFVVLVTGCRPKKNAGSAASYTIATLRGPSSMGMIQLIDSLKNAENTDFRVEFLNEPIQVRKMMLDGSADFAILPTTMAAILYNKGLDYRLIAVPVWGTLYLFGEDTTITGWSNLLHKRVNVMEKGMTPDVLFRYLLQKHGINPDKDVVLDYSFPTHIDLANAVAAGQAKLGVISEPLVSLVMQRNKKVRPIFDLNKEWNNVQGTPIAQTAFLGKGKLLQENPKMAEQLIAAYDKSTRWVNQNPDSAATLIVKYGILPDKNVASQSIPRSNLNFVRARGISEEIEEYLSIFYSMNPEIIGGKLPDENFYY